MARMNIGPVKRFREWMKKAIMWEARLGAARVNRSIGIEVLEPRCVPAAITTLLIENSQPFDRVSEPVTSGVPMPQSLNLTSPGQLRLLDSAGRDVAAQFRVLGRWGGGVTDASRPIRWLEVHFDADVPARTTATYTLDDAGFGSNPSRLSTTQTTERITVSTGPARFEIDRSRFDLFRTVWLDANADGVFDEGERIVTPSANAGAFVGYGGLEFRGNDQAPRSVVLEESGPLRAVVRAEGFHTAAGRPLLRFVTRMTFFAGHSHVEINHTMIEGRQSGAGNESIESQVATTVERAGLRLNLQLRGPITASLRGNQAAVHQGLLLAGQVASIAQARLNDWTSPMMYRGTIGGDTVETGQRATRAWIGLRDARWGVAVGTRDFYQKNPQRLLVGADGSVQIEFPSEPYLIRQAMGLGESVIILFHQADATPARIERVIEGFGKDRLIATAPGEWLRSTGALGDVPGRLPSRWARAEDFLLGSAAASLDHAASGAAFGLMNYFDMPIDRFGRATNPDDTAWGNSYWDPAATLATQFTRTGDVRLLKQLLFPIARHFYTTDMYDPDDSTSFTNGIGGARGVAHRGAWTGEYHYLESLWDYYYLTGDPRALERGLAAARTYAFHPQWAVTADQGGFETTTRALSQKFNTMMEAWLATGDEALKTALDTQVSQYLTRRFTPEGFATAGPATGPSYRAEQAFMLLLGMHDTIFKYFRLTGDPAARAFVVTVPDRISQHHRVGQQPGGVDFMRFHTNVRVDRNRDGSFTVVRTTPHGNSDDFFYVESHVGLATALARAWYVSGNPAYRERAEELFDFAVPQLSPAILDKPGAMASRRLLPGLAVLTRDGLPSLPPPTPQPPAPSARIVLGPVADSFIDGRFGTDPAASHGVETAFSVYREGWSGGQIRPLLKFDLAGIPAGRSLTRAVLRLTQVGGDGPAVPLTVTLRAVSRAWGESQASWRFASADIPWAANGGDTFPGVMSATLPAFTRPGRVVEVEVSSIVRDWMSGEMPNHGLLIETSTSDASQAYGSRESPHSADRPALLLDFEPVTPNTAPTSLSLSPGRIAENNAADALVGRLSATDPDANDRVRLSLPTGRGDNATFLLVGDQLRTMASFDFETRARYEVVVRATDREGLWLERTFFIEILDVDEAPALGGAPVPATFTLGKPPALVASSATVVDPDTDRFPGAVLSVRVASGGTSFDRIGLLASGTGAGQVSVRGSIVQFGGVAIGRLAGGIGTSRLVITFNQRASRIAVEAVVRRVAFHTSANPQVSPRRVIRLMLSEASGASGSALDVSIDISRGLVRR